MSIHCQKEYFQKIVLMIIIFEGLNVFSPKHKTLILSQRRQML